MRKQISENDRLGVYHKCDGRCAYCGSQLTEQTYQVDHYWPVRMGVILKQNYGYDIGSASNLMPSCKICNHYKRADSPDDFRQKMVTLHDRLRKIYINKVAEVFGVSIIKPFNGKFYFETNPTPGVVYPLPLIKS